jgi:iron complex outermembrane receptor protein
MHNRMRSTCLGAALRGVTLIGLAAVALPVGAQAQTSAAASKASSEATLAEIVVTAQKRVQVAEDIPVSLYAVSGAELETQGITSIQEFGNLAAGVSIAQTNPGNMRLTIRGAGDVSDSNQASSVNGFYLDETVMSYVPGRMPEVGLWDVERVEVLRGPQGTLFGDGSEGGTLRVITKKPDSKRSFGRYDAGFDWTAGGGNGYTVGGAVNVPIITDELAVSLSARYRETPGWIAIPDLNLKDSNKNKLPDARFALRYTPSSALTIDAFYLFHKAQQLGDQLGTSQLQLLPSAAAHGAGPVKSLSVENDKVGMAALTITYDFGSASLISASGYTKSWNEHAQDITAGAVAVFPPFFIPGNIDTTVDYFYSRAFTQELRLVSNGVQKLDWTVGGYYKDETRVVDDDLIFNVPAIHVVDFPKAESVQRGKAWAVFADGEYHFTDQWSVEAGVRYFSDKKDFYNLQIQGSIFPLGLSPSGTLSGNSADSTATSPKIGLNFKVNPHLLLFAKYTEGFRAASPNAIPLSKYPQAAPYANPDKLKSYEVGMKATPWAGGYINLYLYDNDWVDLQVPVRTSDNIWTYDTNAGKATMKGLELEVGGKVSEGFRLGLTYSYTDSTISGNVYDNVVPPRLIIKDGAELPYVSKNKIALFGSYETQLTGALKGVVDGHYRISSANFSDARNTPIYENQEARQLFLRMGVSGNWGSLTLFGDNLLNRDDTLAKGPPLGPALYVLNAFVRPRNYGVEYKGTF